VCNRCVVVFVAIWKEVYINFIHTFLLQYKYLNKDKKLASVIQECSYRNVGFVHADK